MQVDTIRDLHDLGMVPTPTRVYVDKLSEGWENTTYIGRGPERLKLPPSIWGNPFRTKEYGRQSAV